MSIDQNVAQSQEPSGEVVAPVVGPTIRQISDGENFSARTEYLGDRKVSAVYAIRRHEKGPRYEKATLFDFSNVTEEQLLLLAMYGVKVKVQAILRALSPEEMLNPSTLASVDVLRDVVSGSRPSGDPVTAAIRTLSKKFGITEEAAREALAEAVASEQQ